MVLTILKRNTPVKASGDGVVSFVGNKSGYGRTVEIKHGGNIKTLYAHLEKFNKKTKVGAKVKQGEIIAYLVILDGHRYSSSF